ncbi:DNA-binding helix-turn-helix protein [[Clostridium] methylpentosum DSM 5476]|jgi:transcriptional regulator with XRE-family HTH domain|uniref:DNA-binding helix-turn-helix protein n=1 Tax=[Clostridium] methylpentosum DSM 5476 TaxID=537013 RepID=C0EB83_9FIRM|nr:DNA-binding helix-turn-helix protein [[Clostridium] methylpentosum DSM 5476]MDY3988059.1 helix-turn-helix transcriptional regulator [Massilioclostridium sp.]MEE1492070.1 helix-turn-helix transcriptional regulator [Massilioclostridium sp.]
MENREIGKRMKLAREQSGLTLQAVADRVGVAASTVQRYEAGGIEKLKLPVLNAIADVLGVDPGWLTGSETACAPADNVAQTGEERKLLMLCRRAEQLPPEKRQKIIDIFESTIDTYLDALGIKDDSDAPSK